MHHKEQPIQLKARQVEVLYESAPFAITASISASIIIALVFWGHVRTSGIMIWLTACIILTGIRYFQVARYKKSEEKYDKPEFWLHNYLILTIISGLLWGLSAYILAPGDQPTYTGFLLLIVCGLIAGAIPSYAVFHRIFYGFTIITIVPLTVYTLTINGSEFSTFAFLFCFFSGFMFLIETRVHHIINHSIQDQVDIQSLLLYIDDEKQHSTDVQKRWKEDSKKYYRIVDKLKDAENKIRELEKQLNDMKK